MLDAFREAGDKPAAPVWPVASDEVDEWCRDHAGPSAAWVKTSEFRGEAGRVLPLPDGTGGIAGAVIGTGDTSDPMVYGALPSALKQGDFRLAADLDAASAELAALSWALGTYSFDHYRKRKEREPVRLVLPDGVDGDEVSQIARAVFLARDLVNTPAADMRPSDLQAAVQKVADTHGAAFSAIVGDELLARNYPMIHAVGRASDDAPRLISLDWGEPGRPLVGIVGKGVCFDTGGLNLKPGSAMALMKKDMGGAACALALADLVMGAKLPVQLKLLIPAVENNISGNAFRPGDVLQSRKGLTVEIGNTDAEGRLILADALADVDADSPDLLVDMATLTGAARVATGPELPPFYTDNEELAASISENAFAVADPLWRLPLWKPYDGWLDSRIADVSHISDGPYAGSITAALFLKRFVEKAADYVHIDLFAWNMKARPGRPIGGEAQAARAFYRLIRERYGGGA